MAVLFQEIVWILRASCDSMPVVNRRIGLGMNAMKNAIHNHWRVLSAMTLAGLMFTPTDVQGGHRFGFSRLGTHCGLSGPYGGRAGYASPCLPAWRSHAVGYVYPRTYPLGYSGYYSHDVAPRYFSPSYASRPFSYRTPRIYVVPQKPPNPYPGPRRIIIYNMGVEEPAEVEGPSAHINPFAEEAAYPPPPPRPQAADPAKAWDYLEAGDSSSALNAFSTLATREPKHGIHKLGFGLAAALSGDKITAAYALRRALESDPDSVSQVLVGQALKQRLSQLANSYGVELRKSPENINVRFLNAVALLLIDDHDAARALLVASIHENEDHAQSIAHLLRLAHPRNASLNLVHNDTP